MRLPPVLPEFRAKNLGYDGESASESAIHGPVRSERAARKPRGSGSREGRTQLPEAMLEARTAAGGAVTFPVRVSPRARRDAIEGVAEGALRVRLAAPPLEGRANEALCRFLAECLKIPRSAVRIVAGERSRRKRVEVRGVALDRIHALARDVPQEPAGGR